MCDGHNISSSAFGTEHVYPEHQIDFVHEDKVADMIHLMFSAGS